MKVVVTGADGFIGSRLRIALIQGGHTVLDFGPVEEIDIRDRRMVQERLSAPAPDLVFHLAAVSGPTLHLQNPEIVMAVNAVGTVNVLTLLDDVRVDISGHS